MKTLVSYDSEVVTLSDKVYRITDSAMMDGLGSKGYHAGDFVRLISGIEGSKTPGHHFNPDYFTVCSITAKTAEFVGVKKIHLQDASDIPISSQSLI